MAWYSTIQPCTLIGPPLAKTVKQSLYVHLTPSLFYFCSSNYNIPGVLSPSASSVNVNKARSYGSISGTRSGSFQRSNSISNIYIPGTTPTQLFSAGSGYHPNTLVEQNEGQSVPQHGTLYTTYRIAFRYTVPLSYISLTTCVTTVLRSSFLFHSRDI